MKEPNSYFTDRSALTEPASTSFYNGWRSGHFIQASGSLVVNVQRTREKSDRDNINWLYFYQLREELTAKRLTDMVGTDAMSLRNAFTRPDFDVRDVVRKIEVFRARALSSLREPANSEVFNLGIRGCRIAVETKSMVEVIVKTREGKTTAADWFHLNNLHRAVYNICRHEKNERDFVWSLARAHGLAVGNGSTLTQLRDQIRGMYGNGGLELLILDEAHNLWPKKVKEEDPVRIEFVRGIWDENPDAMGIASFSTPQSIIALNLAMEHNDRWAPGQYSGRVIRLTSRERPTSGDFIKVAKWHCPEGTDAMIDQLAKFARASDGLFGSMVNVLKVARLDAKDQRRPLSIDHIIAAQIEQISDPELEQALREKGLIK